MQVLVKSCEMRLIRTQAIQVNYRGVDDLASAPGIQGNA